MQRMKTRTVAAPNTGAGSNDKSSLSLTPTERKNSYVLVIDPESQIRSQARTMLRSIGCGEVASATDHAAGLQTFMENYFTHIIFDARDSEMPAAEFLNKVIDLDEQIVAIPSSYEPSVDDVFNLLISGAQGFLVKPFTTTSLEESILLATKGEPISDVLLNAKDRNQALAAFAMTALDKAAIMMRQAQQFQTAQRDLPDSIFKFKKAMEMGKLFSKGGDQGLREACINFCLDRADGPASRLGRARKKRRDLRIARKTDVQEQKEARIADLEENSNPSYFPEDAATEADSDLNHNEQKPEEQDINNITMAELNS